MHYILPIVLKKPKGLRIIVFDVDPYMNEGDEDWFVRVSTRKTNTHEETSNSVIIHKDIKTWLHSLTNDGYILQKNFVLKETTLPE